MQYLLLPQQGQILPRSFFDFFEARVTDAGTAERTLRPAFVHVGQALLAYLAFVFGCDFHYTLLPPLEILTQSPKSYYIISVLFELNENEM